MQFSIQTLELSKIDLADASFRVSTNGASATLINSVKNIGLLTPPILKAESDRYIIVSGFARVQACKKNRMKTVRVCVLPRATSEEWCVRFAVAENCFHRELNLVEQARAVRMLDNIYTSTDELVAAAKNTGLPINSKMVKKLLTVSHMGEDLQKGLESGAIALPIALQIDKIKGRTDRDAITLLFSSLNLSLNRQRELLEWIGAITKRDQIAIVQLLNEEPLNKLRTDTNIDRRQKVALIWQLIKERRMPEISAFEAGYKRLQKKLQLKKGARLVAPPNFEGTIYTLQVDFQNLDEMKEMENEVHRLVHSPHMSQILDQIKK